MKHFIQTSHYKIWALLCLFFITLNVNAEILLVKIGSQGTGERLSSVTAGDWDSRSYASLADALKDLSLADGDDIWVSGQQNLSEVMDVEKGVKIYGGFTGVETTLDNVRLKTPTVINIEASTDTYVIKLKTNDIVFDGFIFTRNDSTLSLDARTLIFVSANGCKFLNCTFRNITNLSTPDIFILFTVTGTGFILENALEYGNDIMSLFMESLLLPIQPVTVYNSTFSSRVGSTGFTAGSIVENSIFMKAISGTATLNNCAVNAATTSNTLTKNSCIEITDLDVDLVGRLTNTSLCINRGKTISGRSPVDIEGETRVQKDQIDIGAFESPNPGVIPMTFISPTELRYDAQAKSVATTQKTGYEIPTIALTPVYTPNTPTNVGDYVVSVTTDSTSYIVVDTHLLSITPAKVTAVTITPKDVDFYTENSMLGLDCAVTTDPVIASLTATDIGAILTAPLYGKDSSSGSQCDIVCSGFSNVDNFDTTLITVPFTSPNALTVVQKEIEEVDVTLVAPANLVYNGEDKIVAAIINVAGIEYPLVSADYTMTYTQAAPVQEVKDAGVYTASFALEANGNFSANSPFVKSLDFTIAPDSVEISEKPVAGDAIRGAKRSSVSFILQGIVNAQNSSIKNIKGVWSWVDPDEVLPSSGISIDLEAIFTPDNKNFRPTNLTITGIKLYNGIVTNGKIVYVSASAGQGDEYNGESSDRPLKSLSLAVNEVQGMAGRSIIVDSGIYYESIAPTDDIVISGGFNFKDSKTVDPLRTIILGNGVQSPFVSSEKNIVLNSMTITSRNQKIEVKTGNKLRDIYFVNGLISGIDPLVTLVGGSVVNSLFYNNQTGNGPIIDVNGEATVVNPTFANNKTLNAIVVIGANNGIVNNPLIQDNECENMFILNDGTVKNATIVRNKNTADAIVFGLNGMISKSVIWNNDKNTYNGTYPAGVQNAFQGVDGNDDIINLNANNDALFGPRFIDPTAKSGKFDWRARPGSVLIDPSN